MKHYFAILLIAICSMFRVASAAAPANDLCSGAIVIPSAGPFPYSTAIISNLQEATSTADPPLINCPNLVSNSVWYKFTPSVSGDFTFSPSADTLTSGLDTVLAIYISPQGNSCNGNFSQV